MMVSQNALTVFEALKNLGVDCSMDEDQCVKHGQDQSPISTVISPDIVVYPKHTQHVMDIVSIANQMKMPIVPFGAGTSVEGHVLPIHGGIAMNMTHMNQILEISPESLTAKVQPGVTRKQLDQALAAYNLCFPIGPGVNATLGGMCSTGASGTNAVKYGTMKENVLGLEVITSEGKLAKTGTKARKTSAGYDLTRLMIGSEGTLGVFTEITLKLYPVPEQISVAICSFESISDAVNSVISIIQNSIPIARVELMDGHTVSLVNDYSQLELSEIPKLILEFHGSSQYISEQVERVNSIVSQFGGSEFNWATEKEERNKLWQARHDTYYAAIASKENARSISTDTCVPIDKLADCLLESINEVNDSGLPYFLVGHVGDGNFHFGYLIDPDIEAERQTAEALNSRLIERAIKFEGTCTGEHGVGMRKMHYLEQELGSESISLMQKIKQALDPNNILNPGKVVLLNSVQEDIEG
ncbi:MULTISPECIES: FAD-binding oxidoreductase [Pseudoalteromonas]|uniref:D-lactate dehydrogenase (cytochrome) n=2 Tax=Pseudoalteromonas TaxID=53246 RepID=A0A8I2H1M0_9GAMM|nr:MULTISPECIES: FAD-linked oxidase C-terminal domain-containing protein [Pseudoalteromonas]KID34522.1 2-hydroxy-acid oxidase [Pseudoalteromonas flavipulchra NCIMB 2033 = ATCC BAA-314]MBD0781567.1 FAD-binding protein [Pseudoalteromonas flavipulchra]MDP4486826.1 FAD-linked oxidase C-terminal domain-containing protein [Pseudoalteromonas piscicida]NLR21476.1 FAD-binding protein [Pseudoalteromonas maricaloris]RZG15480.1 FAD-binding protein [Pseudoalteromonas sp. CO342X]